MGCGEIEAAFCSFPLYHADSSWADNQIPGSFNKLSVLLCAEMNVSEFTRFLLYKEQPPYSTPSMPFVALSLFTKEAFHFLCLTENFKRWLLPKHFQMQSNAAGWFLDATPLPEALAPSSLVNCRHLPSTEEALSCFCIHLRFPWEQHRPVWLHWALFFPTVKWV